jgi:putative nucleotidyltransferase with HDIG domain
VTILELPAFAGYEPVWSALPGDATIYLVGGALRDALLNRPVHDLDLALPGDTRPVGKQAARALGGAFYMLDDERQTARVVFSLGGRSTTLDLARFSGTDLESDLRARDFTINAIAADLRRPDRLIDPTGGAADLRARVLRACAPDALERDPARVLRGIRMALAFGLRVLPETLAQMRAAAPLLKKTSAERKRDELFRLFALPQPASALRLLDLSGALREVLPELEQLKGVTQTPPHTLDVWEHTLAVTNRLDALSALLGQAHDSERSGDLFAGLASGVLGRYRERLAAHLAQPGGYERSIAQLLTLAALYHDIAKPQTRTVGPDGRVHNYGHDDLGADVVAARARALVLSGAETRRVETVVRHHMRIHSLAQTGRPPSRRAIFRFFRDTGEAGVDIALLSLADTLGTYGPTLPVTYWRAELETARVLLEAWWERPEEAVSPPPLLSGDDLLAELGLEPGKLIGDILARLREAQATGKVHTREQALAFARQIADNKR